MLMNIGFKEALKDKDFSCFIFHDVDLLPENDRNIYSCSEKSPRHMSAAVDKFNYKLPYAGMLVHFNRSFLEGDSSSVPDLPRVIHHPCLIYRGFIHLPRFLSYPLSLLQPSSAVCQP